MLRTCALIAALLLTSPAFAEPAPASRSSAATAPVAAGAPAHWSMATGETVSPDRDALRFQLGWPGVDFTYLHGLSNRSDVGLQIELLYGLEGTDVSKFGFGLNVPLRLVVNRKDKILIGLHIDPGMRLYTNSFSTDYFLRFPVGGILGFQVTPEVRLAAAVDLNMAIQIPNSAFFEIGPAFGFGAEYAVDRTLLIGLNTRFGPLFFTSGGGSQFAFTTQVVVGYRL